jgi:small subunit ribosomal protein S1
MKAFCPRSRFSVRPERAPQQQVNKVMSFMIEELKKGSKPRIVLTRLPILEASEKARGQLMAERFNAGDVIQGKVTRLAKFGVFVDVGDSIEGLIPMSELSHGRVERASDVLKAGQSVDVKVLSVDPQRGRLSLSVRALTPDPWVDFTSQNAAGSTLQGRVTRITDFGAFVELAPSVEGLLHVSAISATGRVNHPSDHLSSDQEVEVVIQEIVKHDQSDKRRIRLMTKEVAERRKPVTSTVNVGDVITVPVKEITERGIALEIEGGLEGFIPASETGTQRGANLKERFSLGQSVQAKVTAIDMKRRRARLSIKALENHEEEMAFKSYREEMRSEAARMTSTFGDLLKNFQ